MKTTFTTTTVNKEMKAFLIVEGGDPKTAEWYFANASWKALDAAKADGFCETKGFAVAKTLEISQMSFPA